jgi:hypothetical protein
MSVMDIREAINEIMEIMNDKIEMKTIDVKQTYKSFDDKYALKTDFKRL